MTDETIPLPCPFCGYLSNISPRMGEWRNGVFFLFCGKCNAQSPNATIEKEVIKLWNTRTPDKTAGLQEAREQIKLMHAIVAKWYAENYGKESDGATDILNDLDLRLQQIINK